MKRSPASALPAKDAPEKAVLAIGRSPRSQTARAAILVAILTCLAPLAFEYETDSHASTKGLAGKRPHQVHSSHPPATESDFVYAVVPADAAASIHVAPSLESEVLGCLPPGSVVLRDDFKMDPPSSSPNQNSPAAALLETSVAKDPPSSGLRGWTMVRIPRSAVDSSCRTESVKQRNTRSPASTETEFVVGYLHEARFKRFSAMDRIPPGHRTVLDLAATYAFDSLEVRIRTEKFDRTRHRIMSIPDGCFLIDDRLVWGHEIGNPKLQISDIALAWAGVPMEFPKTWIRNLYEIDLERVQLFENAGLAYLFLEGGDGPGHYWLAFTLNKNHVIAKALRLGSFAHDRPCKIRE